jgi:hypothetical protein
MVSVGQRLTRVGVNLAVCEQLVMDAVGDALSCLPPMNARNNRILDIDGDSFFASCEIALDPKWEGHPVWVTAATSRSN